MSCPCPLNPAVKVPAVWRISAPRCLRFAMSHLFRLFRPEITWKICMFCVCEALRIFIHRVHWMFGFPMWGVRRPYIICTEFHRVRNCLCLNDLLIITPELLPCINLCYSVIVIQLSYSNVRIHKTRHLYLTAHSANILNSLRAESWVIPSWALAAGLGPTWQPGKLIGNPDSAW